MQGSHFDPTTDTGGASVFVGAQVPAKLYHLLKQEAQEKMVSGAQVIRWALAERYSPPRQEEGSPSP